MTIEHAIRPAVEVRESILTGVDFKQRLIDVIAVPYEQEAEVMYRGEVWREVFDRHSFDGIEEHAGRVRVNREHSRGDTVGKVVHFDPSRNDGLLARVKVAKTLRGDETLALADDDMLSASVGYMVRGSDQQLDKRSKLRRIMRAFMDHLSMVEQPAYEGAKVLAVREGLSAETEVSQGPLSTPELDVYLNDDVLRWANEHSA